jgi:acetylglutamate kinase
MNFMSSFLKKPPGATIQGRDHGGVCHAKRTLDEDKIKDPHLGVSQQLRPELLQVAFRHVQVPFCQPINQNEGADP